MKKITILFLTVLASVLTAGVYGILHDQITYSISEEYFTKYKYSQFGLEPEWFGGNRQTVAVIGFLATWWVGLFIGICLGSVGLIFSDPVYMWKAIKKAIVICISFAVAGGIAGFLYGQYMLTSVYVDWLLPEAVVNRGNFVTVGYIHNYSYLGGFLGLFVGIIYLFRLNWVYRRRRKTAV